MSFLKTLKRMKTEGIGFGVEDVIRQISPKWAFQRQAYRNAISAASTQYAAAARTNTRGDWNFVSGIMWGSNPPNYELNELRNRSRDANRNDPLATALTGTMATNIAGTGLQLQSKLRADRLGIPETKAEDIRQEIEHCWDLFSKACDSQEILSFDEYQWMVVKKTIEDGEIITLPVWHEKPYRKFGRALQLVECDRLGFSSQTMAGQNLPDGRVNDTGIELGNYGEPLRYSLRRPNNLIQYDWFNARDGEGRLALIHNFRPTRPWQVRGVPLIAPVLTMLKDLGATMEATVMRARVAACLSVIFTKQNPLDQMLGNASSAFGDKSQTSTRVEELYPGMVHYAGLGETATTIDPAPSADFDPFITACMRMICASVGLPYELVVKDFSKTNYSSARAALLEGRRTFNNWRKWLGEKYCQLVFNLILEEMFLRDFVQMPGFYEMREEYERAEWIGGGWGWVDPVKEIEASNMAIESGLSTLATECASNGTNYKANLAQRMREIPMEAEAGIVRNLPGKAVSDPGNPEAGEPQTGQNPQKARRALLLAEAYRSEK